MTGLLRASDPDITATAFHGDWSRYIVATNFHIVTGLRINLSRPRIFTRRLVYIQIGIDEFIAVPAALVAVVQRIAINTVL